MRVILGSLPFAGALTPMALSGSCSAQTDSAAPIPESVDSPDTLQSDAEPGVPDSSPVAAEDDPEQAPADLETGLPRSVLLTPFHWGRLSLLSLTAYQGYNSNPEFRNVPLGTWLTSISALTVYSAQFAGWRLDAQYRPFLWLSSKRTFKDFAAASLDLRTARRINPNWHWTANERLQYSPTRGTEEQRGFVFDPGRGIAIGNAFLSSGRNILTNGAAVTLTDRYSEQSSWLFHANQDFIRLSSYVGSTTDLPTQEAISYGAGATWRDHYSLRNTLSLRYAYRAQTTAGTSAADVNSHLASIGWSRQLKPGLDVSTTFGPGWSIYAGNHSSGASNRTTTTLHGSVSLSKEFHRGGVIFAFVRSNSFSGIISDSFHNRYDVAVHQALSARWHCSATVSYLQQQASNRPDTRGTLGSAEVNYFISRNWSTFAQVRYLDIAGSARIFAPEKTAIVGFRWSWVPEKP